jgi:hypothetical protein
MIFDEDSAVGLDQVLKRIPADVDPQDVTLALIPRGIETDVEVSWDEEAEG